MATGKGVASKEVDDTLKGWTREDKFRLHEALRVNGTRNIPKIMECTKKTEEEVVQALNYYKKQALKSMPPRPSTSGNTSKKEKIVNLQNQDSIPLVGWAKIMLEKQGDHVSTGTSTALRLIAEFEDMPNPKDTYGINFRDVYYALANAMEGRPVRVNKKVGMVIRQLVIETAKVVEKMDKSIIEKPPAKNDSVPFEGSSSDIELNALRHLISQEEYNPLKIPEESLKIKKGL